MFKYYIGRELRSRRESKGMSQYDLARAAAVPQTTINQTELDQTQPTIGLIRDLEAALDARPGELYLASYPETERLPQVPRRRGRPQKQGIGGEFNDRKGGAHDANPQAP